MLLHIDEVIKDAVYIGYGDDKHDHSIKAHLFEVVISNKKSWMIVREFSEDRVELHSISDNESIKVIIQKNRISNQGLVELQSTTLLQTRLKYCKYHYCPLKIANSSLK